MSRKPQFRLRYGAFSEDFKNCSLWPNLSKPVVAIQVKELFGWRDIKKFLAYVPIYNLDRQVEAEREAKALLAKLESGEIKYPSAELNSA